MKKSDDKYNNTIEKISMLFFNDFNTAIDNAEITNSSRLSKYTSAFFRQWHYSALVDNSVLTPVNILNAIYDKEIGYYAPTIKMKNKSISSGFNISMRKYNIDEHPIFEDLKALTNMFVPDLELTSENMFQTASLNKILPKLSISDPFYSEYLIELSLSLRLIKKIPSLYVNKVCLSSRAENFFELSSYDKFHEIVTASYKLTNTIMVNTLKIYGNFFTIEVLEELLKNPNSTDNIYKNFYSSMGMDIENLFNIPSRPDIVSDFEESFMTSSFVLGILIDKYFFSIYGYFLKLIDPIYILPFDFGNTLDFIQQVEYNMLITILHAPCTTYSVTPLGMEYFEIEVDEEKNNNIKLNCESDKFLDMIIASYSSNDLDEIHNNFTSFDKYDMLGNNSANIPQDVYVLKVKVKDFPELWRNIEVSGNMPLCYLHLFISDIFHLDAKESHEFYMSKDENPFTKFVSPILKDKKSKTSDIPLNSFDIEKDFQFVYVALDTENPFSYEKEDDDEPLSYETFVKFEITVMSIKDADLDESYPKIQRTSAELKQIINYY